MAVLRELRSPASIQLSKVKRQMAIRKQYGTSRDPFDALTPERAALVKAVGLGPEKFVHYQISTKEFRRMVKAGEKVRVGRDPGSAGVPLTLKQRMQEASKAKRFFNSLRGQDRWELNDRLVLGDFDWREWMDIKPSRLFMSTLADELSLWEQSQ